MEVYTKQFYEHRSFVNIYYYLYISLEKWITKNIFREDPSRVFLASDDYAFRRRFELTDMSENFEDIDVSSLRFPFANYWPLNSGWQPDKRVAATTAALVYAGIYEGNTKINAIPSIISIPTTFYFDREDDARMAYEVLYFKSFNEHYYTQEVPYAGNTLELPANMVIDNIEFNPKFTEEDWLKQNRIFTVKAVFNMRSYAIQPPKQPNYMENVDENGYISPDRKYDDGRENNYIVDEVIMNFWPGSHGVIPEQIRVNGTVDDPNIKINNIRVLPIDNSTAKISWVIDSSSDKISKIMISTDSGLSFEDIDPEKAYYIIDKLSPGGKYKLYISFFSDRGASKKFAAPFELPIDLKALESQKPATASLVGISW